MCKRNQFVHTNVDFGYLEESKIDLVESFPGNNLDFRKDNLLEIPLRTLRDIHGVLQQINSLTIPLATVFAHLMVKI